MNPKVKLIEISHFQRQVRQLSGSEEATRIACARNGLWESRGMELQDFRRKRVLESDHKTLGMSLNTSLTNS